MRTHRSSHRIDFRNFNNYSRNPLLHRYRKIFLTNICLARKEILRLKSEIAEIPDILPYGACIGRNIKNYNMLTEESINKYEYFTLSHKTPIFLNTKTGNASKKQHIGSILNPHYREALILVEKSRVRQLKLETLSQLEEHLRQLKSRYDYLCKLLGWSKNYSPPEETPEIEDIYRILKDDELITDPIVINLAKSASEDLTRQHTPTNPTNPTI